MGDNHGIRILAILFANLPRNLAAERLDAGNCEWSIKRSIKIARFFEQSQKYIEQFGPDRKLDNFRAVGFTGTAFFENFRLSNAAAIKDFLHNNAAQTLLSGLRGDGRAIVTAGS